MRTVGELRNLLRLNNKEIFLGKLKFTLNATINEDGTLDGNYGDIDVYFGYELAMWLPSIKSDDTLLEDSDTFTVASTFNKKDNASVEFEVRIKELEMENKKLLEDKKDLGEKKIELLMSRGKIEVYQELLGRQTVTLSKS